MSCSKISTIEIPISIRWKISKERLQEERNQKGWYIESEMFTIAEIPGIQYCLVIGCVKNEQYDMCIGFIIHMNEKLNITAGVKISIPSAAYVGVNHNVKTNNGDVYGTFIGTIDEFFEPSNNFIVNDSTIITAEGTLRVESDKSDGILRNYQMKSESLGPLLWNRDDKDFAIIVDNKEIEVHKNVIGAKSSVFDRMIQSGLTESKENKVTIIDFDYDTVYSAIKFCYGFDGDILLNIEKASNLIQFADKYNIIDLKTSVETFLESKISPMHVCKIANTSIFSNSISLREKCFEFLLECNQEKTPVNDLDQLDKDFSSQLMKASFSHITM